MSALDPLEVVRNTERLVEIYDGWPYCHDAEIVEIRCARNGEDEFDGPQVWITVHFFHGKQDPSTPSGFHWYNHTLTTFRFGRVHDLEIRGLNHQNAIFELELERAGPHPVAPGVEAFRVRFVPSYGAGISLLCDDIEVTAIEPGRPPFSVYSD